MAVSNVNVGLGIGMSGQSTAPDQIFRAQQQQDLYKAKAAQKKAEDEDAELAQITKKILVDKPKVHRLESKKASDEMGRTLMKINDAKRTSPNDYLNTAYEELGNYANTLNQATTRSRLLEDFETQLQKKSPNQYVSSSVQKARDLLNQSETTEEWMDKLEKNGIESNNYFSYDKTNGTFGFQIPASFDPAKEVTGIYSSKKDNPIGLTKNIEKLAKGESATKFTFKKGIPRTQKEADEIYSNEVDRRVAEKESVTGMPAAISGERIAINYLSVPEKAAQYADMYPETRNMSDEQRINHFLENFYDPYSPYKEDTKFFKEGKPFSITIGGGDEPASEFLFTEDTGTFYGTDVPYFGQMAVAVKGKFSSSAIVLNDVIDMSTKKELNVKDVDVRDKNIGIQFGQIYVVPVIKEGNKKRLVTQAEIDSKKVKPTYEVRQTITFSGLEGLGTEVEAITKSTTLWPVDKVKSMLYTQGLKSTQIATLNRELVKAKKKASSLNGALR
jgi:hypothetical protein